MKPLLQEQRREPGVFVQTCMHPPLLLEQASISVENKIIVIPNNNNYIHL